MMIMLTGGHLFASLAWPDATIGLILLIASLATLILCLLLIVRLLHSLLQVVLRS